MKQRTYAYVVNELWKWNLIRSNIKNQQKWIQMKIMTAHHKLSLCVVHTTESVSGCALLLHTPGNQDCLRYFCTAVSLVKNCPGMLLWVSWHNDEVYVERAISVNERYYRIGGVSCMSAWERLWLLNRWRGEVNETSTQIIVKMYITIYRNKHIKWKVTVSTTAGLNVLYER